ncbi:MAG: cell surface protein SprA [Cytophagales bacterium]|nr:cell surface protein SprA [Cytophagales bacterium]
MLNTFKSKSTYACLRLSLAYTALLIGLYFPEVQANIQQVPGDSISTDSAQAPLPVREYEKSRQPIYQPQDRPGNSILYPGESSPLILKDPNSLQLDVEVDTSLNYSIGERFGDIYYRPPINLNFEQYNQLHGIQMRKNYWKEMSVGNDGESAVSGRRLIPPIYISPAFDRIFGGSFVDIRPNGFVMLDFGGRWQRIQNPSIPIRQQRNGGFEFDQQISMNVVGKIGEKLSITADFDNNNSFDFENNLKVEYTGFEEDIIQKIEIGNVSLPLTNSLITGAQNLFGVKTQLRFGKLDITAVASTQRGKSDEIEINGGSDGGQGREFEIRGSEYEENRHFFLGHFFRDNYETWLSGTPQIISGVNVTRIEVYIINRQNNTETLRNFLAFMDLAEGSRIYRPDNPKVGPGAGGPNRNEANNLFNEINNTPGLRNIDNSADILENQFDFDKATDYESVTAARKLDEREYVLNRQLGQLSLLRKLQSDEVLAVAYEYTYNGQIYKVGELTEDYQNRPEDEAIFLKLLRPSKIAVAVPSWDLMMKNIYSLNATQLSREGFQLRIVYRDDKTGLDNPSLHEGKRTKDIPLVQLMNLDRLNANNDPQPDGNFDYIPNITVREQSGLIVFPVLEPFGSKLKSYFDPDTEANLINKYVYDTLYGTTKADAELDMSKNKFFLKGRMQAGSAQEIILPGINISENSVTVMAGNTPLVEGQDYRVDYNLGRVTILNEAVLNSGKPIKVSYEKADMFNFQSRSLIGTRLDYRLSDHINFGGTFLYLNERPLISRVSIGNEPTRNMKYGMDVNIQKDSRLLTRMVDALPLIQTKAPSSISFNAEIAQIRPGTSNFVNGEETSYIDDFEATATPFNLGNSIQSWKLAHTPITEDKRFMSGSGLNNDLRLGYKRAKFAWYIIDNIFYRGTGPSRPTNITDEDKQNHYVRQVPPQEIFNRDREVVNTNLPILDLAYYPMERGQYNFNPELNSDGYLNNPKENWGGVTRAITSDVDFDRNNIEFIDFWLMDPFISGENGRVLDGIINENNDTGGKFIINLGSISEDVIKDNRHGFENGLPADGDVSLTKETNWGRVTEQQYLTNAFDNSSEARFNQDIGMDGLRSAQEAEFENYQEFLDALNGINPEARERILKDVSADDFQYYLGDDLDAGDIKIQERYKNFNGTENNSPVVSDVNAAYTPSGTNLPDNEDLNRDNTISDLEEYYEYEMSLKPGELEIGKNYIIDKVVPDEFGGEVTWYQFRIPIRRPTRTQGNISGFKSIRFIRMYATEFDKPVVLRLAQFQLVGSQWRKFEGNLYQRGLYEIPEPYDPKFNVSVVNIEENGSSGTNNDKIPYVLPPGIKRDFDNTSPIVRQVNEQSLLLTVQDLKDRDARAVYKNMTTDLINYKRLKMFFHAQENGAELEDDEVTAFVRLGTDFTENYYEIEVPLKITQLGATSDREIWPEENEINLAFDELFKLKSERNRLGINTDLPYSDTVGIYRITVEGRPELQTVQTIMIGIRNPESVDERPLSVTIWANEMRVTDFERTPGWAANAYLNAKMADLMTLTASTRYTSFGFGGIQESISQRTREETFEYDISANVQLDKFLPEKSGIKIPMYVSYENRRITPHFDPLDPDIPLKSALNAIEDPEERKEYKKLTQDRLERRSINFTNVRKVKTKEGARSKIYDIENISLTYAYADATQSNVNMESYKLKSHRGTFAYNFSPQGGLVEPFKNSNSMKSKYLKLIKDFNFSVLPSNLSFRADLDRRFVRTQLRNSDLTTTGIRPMYEKYFTFNRSYNLRWSLTKNLSLDYFARANTIIDEPYGDLDTQEKQDVVWTNLKNFGRMKNFDQHVGATYRLPLDKLPLTDWLNSELRYSVDYSWNAGAWSEIDSLNLQKILGNISQNSREAGVTGKLDFVKLYNKSRFLKEINSPPRRSRSRTRPSSTQVQDTTKKSEMKALKGIARFLMMVRSINVNYSIREGTMLPGYALDPFLFGMDETWSAPGWDFILGSQSTAIRNRAAENNWLVQDTLFSQPFTQTRTYDLNLKALVEPFKSFRIQFDAMKRATGNFNEVFRVDSDPSGTGLYNGLNISRGGSYSISINSMRTSFVSDFADNSSPNFTKFEDNLEIVKNRLNALNPNEGTYATQSQDVMIPAFIAAYTGKDAGTIELTPFPKVPIPGWRINYSGLGNIPALKEVFSTVSLEHSYSSTYSINNYSNSLLYQDDLELDGMLDRYPVPSDTNELGEFIAPFIMNQIVISERYAPLIGISIRTKSRITANIKYMKERNLGLNISNSQITELSSNDLSVTFGFTKANMKLPFKVQGAVITLKNDLTFKFNFTLRDTKTVQRKIDEVHTVTAGNVNFQLRPQLGYVLSERLNLNAYFERNVNTPRITSSYPRSTTQFGVQVRFSLAQ